MSKPGWKYGVVENEIKKNVSIFAITPHPTPTAPKARKKKEQPAPTSKPGGGDAKQCGTPQHPSALASAEVVVAAGVMPASTPLRAMEQAEKDPVAVTRLRIRQEAAAWTTSSKDSPLPLSAGRVGTG